VIVSWHAWDCPGAMTHRGPGSLPGAIQTRRPSERVRHAGHSPDPGPGRASREVGMLPLIRSTYASQRPLESGCHVQHFCLSVPARHSGHDIEPRASARVLHHRMTWCTSIVRLRTSLWMRPTSSRRTAGRPARTALAARSSTPCARCMPKVTCARPSLGSPRALECLCGPSGSSSPTERPYCSRRSGVTVRSSDRW